MPATATHVLNTARSQIGYRERRGNRTRYGEWYGLDGGPWCAIFISWVADKANAEDIIPRHAYTPAGAAWFMQRARWGQKPRRGDIVYYEFPGMGRISHVGIVETVHSDGSITAIEGNTSPAGSRTGGQVMRKRRSGSLIAGFGHPAYVTAARMAVLKRQAAADARASRLAKARALAAAKLKAARAKAAAALATKKRKAAAVAAAALAAAAAASQLNGGAPVQPAPVPSVSPTATPSVSATPLPSVTSTPAASPKPTVRPTPKPKPVPAVVTLRRTLKYVPGRPIQHGADVRRVQVLIGLKRKAVDGDFGRMTAAKVKVWQRAHSLKPDGEFGARSARRASWRWSP